MWASIEGHIHGKMWVSIAKYGHKQVVKLLVDHGADKNMQNKVSVTDIILMRDIYVRLYVCCL